MSKNQSSLKYILKIRSSRFRKAKWSLNLTLDEAFNNNEVVSLADSTALRFIREIKDKELGEPIYSEIQIKTVKESIQELKKEENNSQNRKRINELHASLKEMLYEKHYLNVIVDRNSDFDRMNSQKGFHLNGIKYIRLLATTGGAKQNTVVYVSELVYPTLIKRIDNGRNKDVPLVPAKLEAYKALTCSASSPVSNPKGILVVKDCFTHFRSNVIKVDDSKNQYPTISYEDNYEIELNDSDGYGLILPSLSEKWSNELGESYIPSGFCIRNSFCKGMLFTFDFIDFANKVARNETVVDVWGEKHNINDVEIILTESMLKLWSSYINVSDYLSHCSTNNYSFSVTKITPEVLDNERALNYQFIQSLDLDEDDIDELIAPTVSLIRDIVGLDYRKTILFLKGQEINEKMILQAEADIVKALTVDKRMIHDPFIRSKVIGMIKNRIKEAKVGVLNVSGNFSTISGDPYSLCQSIFNLPVTGLLKSGESYSHYWTSNGVKLVAAFRAPMTCHNNIRKLRIVSSPEMNQWYKYMNTVTIFNSWDTTTHALNGADKDGDTVFTTNNPVVLKSVKDLRALVCIQKTAPKKIAQEEDFIKANKDSFGDDIGATTNRITSMFDVQARFNKNTAEHKEIEYRIMCGQNYQQNSIDKAKGIEYKPMPKEWFDYKANIYYDSSGVPIDKNEFNLSILAEKKPYFFTYIYPEEERKYRKYIEQTERNCYSKFGVGIKQLSEKNDLNEQESAFLEYYAKKMPVFTEQSVMNRICFKIEKQLDNLSPTSGVLFDHSLLKTNKPYSASIYKKISKLYVEHNKRMKEYNSFTNFIRLSKTEKLEAQNRRRIFIEEFKEKALAITNNIEDLCNISIDLCYKNNKSKQFVWDICGEQIIKNLLSKNNHTYSYPVVAANGSIKFNGNSFEMITVQSEV